jgi:muramoyltetrapeptide carboxypeptidase
VPFSKPEALRPGAAISLVAPAGPFDRPSFDRGLAVLSARYDVRFDEGLFAQARYLAGDDAHRRHALRSAFEGPAEGIFCARGGYGSMRLLPSLDLPSLPHKPLVGFSDITALHLALQAHGRVSIHGPVLTQLGRQAADVSDRLWHLLESTEPAPPLFATETFVPGIAEGPLLGGNLSVLTRLLGTPFLPDLHGAILLLEDVGERPYRLDRMWTHLELAGVLDKVSGLALGEFTLCEEQGEDYGPTDVLRELALKAGLPCVLGLPIGHGGVNQPVPLGCKVRLDAGAKTLHFLEGAVR